MDSKNPRQIPITVLQLNNLAHRFNDEIHNTKLKKEGHVYFGGTVLINF